MKIKATIPMQVGGTRFYLSAEVPDCSPEEEEKVQEWLDAVTDLIIKSKGADAVGAPQ